MLAVDRRTAELALDWCRAKWGKSRYVKGRPRLRLLKRSRQELYGWYNESLNLITLRLDWHESPLDLIETVIHEYTHYLQDIAGRYDRLAEEYKDLPYDHHPLEKQAYKRQARWGARCLAEIGLMQYISNINQIKYDRRSFGRWQLRSDPGRKRP